MDDLDLERPRNTRLNFCDKPNVSPIEFNRNSSLIVDKSHTLGVSFEKLVEDEKCFLIKEHEYKENEYNNLLDSKFNENEFSIDSSYEDLELSFDDRVVFSFTDNHIQKSLLENESKTDLNDSIPYVSSFERKSQKALHREAKLFLSAEKSHLSDSIPIYRQYEQTNIEKNNSDSSLLYDSFSLSEGMVVSPIAHELSQINGKELDVSNFFSCDFSSFE